MGGRGASSFSSGAGDGGGLLGKAVRVSWSDLSAQEARQLQSDYNWQYERGVFEDGKAGDLYQSNYLYRIRCHGFDRFELLWRRRIL